MKDPIRPTIERLINGSTDDDEQSGVPAGADGFDAPNHAHAVGASGVTLQTDAARTGDRWATTLYVAEWPQAASPGFLEQVATHPSADVDVSIHADPRDDAKAVKHVDDAIRDLRTEKKQKESNGDPSVDKTKRRIAKHEDVLEQLTDESQSIFDVSVYITIRGDTEEQVQRTSRRLTNNLSRQQVTVKTVDHRQSDGLVAGSPVARDPFGSDVPAARTPMLGGAVGALFPFSAKTIIEPNGTLVGYHATTDAPVVDDRYDRPNGYNVLTAGIIGAGKSFGTKALLLRQLAKDPETALIMIDPLQGFRALSDALDGERVVIGGRRGLNPLEIRRTPDDVLAANPDLNPYGERYGSVMGFFETFFSTVNAELGEKRPILGAAVTEAYDRQGITVDPSTHGNPSPTVIPTGDGRADVYSVLGEISTDAETFLHEQNADAVPDDVELAAPTTGEIDKWEARAEDLRIAMRPFLSGEYTNLGGTSDVNLQGEKVVYLDLQQGEGDREVALMMQLLLDTVYERAKETDKNVVLAIDEAHYLMQNEGSLDWLDRLVRHSRHYNLSLHLVTQKASDFFVHEKAKTIADNCSQKILHRLPGLSDEHADMLSLTDREANFVRKAKPGTKERGYSHALVDVQDKTKLPVKVEALPEEARLIENEENDAGDGATSPDDSGGGEQDESSAETAPTTDAGATTSDATNAASDGARADAETATDGGATGDVPTADGERPPADGADVWELDGVGSVLGPNLRAAGYETVGDVRAATVYELTDAEQVAEKTAKRLKAAADGDITDETRGVEA